VPPPTLVLAFALIHDKEAEYPGGEPVSVFKSEKLIDPDDGNVIFSIPLTMSYIYTI
jgi:hypothetical protein